MKSFIIIFLLLFLPWFLFFYLSLTPQLVLIKHLQPEKTQFIYKDSVWLIPFGFMVVIYLNLVLAKILEAKIFTKLNYFIIAYNIILVAYLIYLNY
jgi:hypothetical protein